MVFDLKEWEQQGKKDKDRGPKPSTGGWVNIYEGPLLDVPVGAFGTDMTIKGEAIKTKRPFMQSQGSFVANKFQSTNTSQDSTTSEYVPSNSSNNNNSSSSTNNFKMDAGRDSLSVNAMSIQARGLGDVKSRHSSTGSSKPTSFKPAPLPSPRKEKPIAPPSPQKDKFDIPVRSAEKKPSLSSKHSAKDSSPRTTAGFSLIARADSKKDTAGFDDSDDENAAPPGVDNDGDKAEEVGGGDDDLDDDLDELDLDDPTCKVVQVAKGDAVYSRRKAETSYVVPAGAKAIPIKVFEVEF